jgi:DNA-binding response OmpR family regulator
VSNYAEPQSVVLVDDEQDIRTVGEMALSTVGGWEVRSAASGESALRMVAEELPDVLILDVMMPVMDGPSTLRRLRECEHGRKLPVVFLTAKTRAEDEAKYLAMGAAGVIAKPFDPMVLADQVRAILLAHLS